MGKFVSARNTGLRQTQAFQPFLTRQSTWTCPTPTVPHRSMRGIVL